MAQNEPQRKETPPGPSPNSPSLLLEYQCRSGKFIRLANRVESKLFSPELECSNVQHRFRNPANKETVRRKKLSNSVEVSWMQTWQDAGVLMLPAVHQRGRLHCHYTQPDYELCWQGSMWLQRVHIAVITRPLCHQTLLLNTTSIAYVQAPLPALSLHFAYTRQADYLLLHYYYYF